MPISVPTDISGCEMWFDASDTATITNAGGGAVSAWADKTGNYGDVEQATGANRPTTGMTTLNGLNVIDFDGTNDFLTFPGTDPILTAFGSFTTFVVFRCASEGALVADANTSDNDPTYVLYIVGGPEEPIVEMSTNSGPFVLLHGNATDVVDGDFHVLRLTDTASGTATVTLTVDNGTPSSTTYTRGSTTITKAGFGARPRATPDMFLDGSIAEVIVYNAVLSAPDIADVESYLATKWFAPSTVVSPTTVTSAAVINAPNISSAASPTTVTSAGVIGAPTILAGNSVSPTTVTSAVVVSTPTVRRGATVFPRTVMGRAVVNTPADFLFDKIIYPETVDAG